MTAVGLQSRKLELCKSSAPWSQVGHPVECRASKDPQDFTEECSRCLWHWQPFHEGYAAKQISSQIQLEFGFLLEERSMLMELDATLLLPQRHHLRRGKKLALAAASGGISGTEEQAAVCALLCRALPCLLCSKFSTSVAFFHERFPCGALASSSKKSSFRALREPAIALGASLRNESSNSAPFILVSHACQR